MPPRILAFDSGIGGLGIVAELRDRLPGAAIAYVADNAAFPYGQREDGWLRGRIAQVVRAAIDRVAPDIVVVACNTASTIALDHLRARFDRPFVGCVPPIKWAAGVSRSRHIGLLATAATVRRAYLRDLQARFAPDCTLIAHGARGLADLAEARFLAPTTGVDTALRMAVGRELVQLFGQPGGDAVDAVAIGCTHYSFLLDALQDAAPPGIAWLDPAGPVARRTAEVLALRPEPEGPRPDPVATAFFTAPPTTPNALALGLARFGYDGFSLMPVADGLS